MTLAPQRRDALLLYAAVPPAGDDQPRRRHTRDPSGGVGFSTTQWDKADLVILFFAARVLNAASHAGAAWLAGRIGVLNTMVWTHLPSSLFLIAAPVSPTASTAAALFLARGALVEMDVPTRQADVMAVVKPAERTLRAASRT